ncbi:MAG: PHP domain-containing protein [Pseudomonadota bacterium]
MKHYDLHSHSTASDGSLTPAQLINLAKESGVDCLALTDHDGIDGIEEAKLQAKSINLEFIPGIELSVTWGNFTIHIVGLNINTDYAPLLAGTHQLKLYRLWRAQQISKGLEEFGIKGALSGAQKFSNGKMIGRMHFANFLVANGNCKDVRTVFKKFLVKNKPGYVHGQWASLEDVISWITGAGGVAVIAHPGRYPFKNKKLKMLLYEFIELGGKAIEVVSGSHSIQEVARMTSIAREFELYASMGSDFHNPDASWNKLGKLTPLPEQCTPVWKAWEPNLEY